MSVASRFMEKVQPEPTSGCWLWIGNTDRDGYGRFNILAEKIQRAHRAAYHLFVGPLDPSMVIMHSCDNRACVNPQHLRQGTQKENFHDCLDKGRMPRKTHCKRGHAITPENQVTYGKQTRCRPCHAIRESERYYGKR